MWMVYLTKVEEAAGVGRLQVGASLQPLAVASYHPGGGAEASHRPGGASLHLEEAFPPRVGGAAGKEGGPAARLSHGGGRWLREGHNLWGYSTWMLV